MMSTTTLPDGSTHESILRTITDLLEAEGSPLDRALDALWRSYGKTGPAPPLYVCQAVHDRFVAEGCSPGKLVKSNVMPPGKAAFFDPNALIMGATS
jgi:hypothetical protein